MVSSLMSVYLCILTIKLLSSKTKENEAVSMYWNSAQKVVNLRAVTAECSPAWLFSKATVVTKFSINSYSISTSGYG